MILPYFAQMVKLVDTPDLGSGAARYVGSSPILGKSPEIFEEMSPVFYFLALLQDYLNVLLHVKVYYNKSEGKN